MIGLARGTVALLEHDESWIEQAQRTIDLIRKLLGDAAVDIQHVGSTAVSGLDAKPIIDIVIGVQSLAALDAHVDALAKASIREAAQDLPQQRLFVMGEFERDTRTHHIHAVLWNGTAWKNYIRFRDYLRAFSEKRAAYEAEKHALAALYPQDRTSYTKGKAALIETLLEEANKWAEEAKTMAKVILLCGKIASGKSVYAQTLCKKENAVLLSVDELVLSALGSDLGEKHEEVTERIQAYLFKKSLEIVACGTNVLLDWGFWTKQKRQAARAFYEGRGIACEFHYIDVPDAVWRRNIDIRNRAVLAGEDGAYFVDEGLMAKLKALFEAPQREEIDVWFVNDWQ